MASFTVEKRKTAAGVIRYRCIVSVKKDKAIVYQESRTFGKLADARTWGKAMVSHIETQGIPGQAPIMPTIRELITMYQQDPDISKKIGRTKGYVLNLLADSDISKLQADKLTTMAIINHCRDRNAAGARPQTVAQDISYLKSVYMSAKPVFGIPVTDEVIPVLHSMGLIGRSERRSRRPTGDELDKLRAGLVKRMNHRGSKIPLTDILDFSVLSCMRISEVCGIRWDDIDDECPCRHGPQPQGSQEESRQPYVGGASDRSQKPEPALAGVHGAIPGAASCQDEGAGIKKGAYRVQCFQ